MNNKTLKQAIIEALENLGGTSYYKDIYDEIVNKNLFDFKNSKTPEKTISRVLQENTKDTNYGTNDSFYSVYGIKANKGIWGLSKYKEINEFSDLDNLETSNKKYNEGKEVIKEHKTYERNEKLVRDAKNNFKQNNSGKIFCEICGFDFSKVYGEIGDGFIEAHHKKPVSKMKNEECTKIDDLIMVCSNCHRMLHRKLPWIEVDELKNSLKAK